MRIFSGFTCAPAAQAKVTVKATSAAAKPGNDGFDRRECEREILMQRQSIASRVLWSNAMFGRQTNRGQGSLRVNFARTRRVACNFRVRRNSESLIWSAEAYLIHKHISPNA